MVLNVKSLWRNSHKNNFFVKLSIAFMLLGLGFTILYSRSNDFLDVSEDPEKGSFTNGIASIPPISSSVPEKMSPISPTVDMQDGSDGKCNIFAGDWVPSPDGPAYTNDTCSVIESHQNCMTNGRPDSGFVYWKWSPRDCELPQLDPRRFLQIMRNKNFALIGDSISRNHVQSLLCILSKVEQAVQTYHDEGWKSRRWIFPSYNFTVSVLWSPFLAEAAINEDINGVSTREIELHLDKIDRNWTSQYQNMDYVIFSSGKWYIKSAIYYENNAEIGCHACSNRNCTEVGLDLAYRKVLNLVFDHIVASNHKGMTFFRTSTPEHFENGEWYNGGFCNRTQPVKEGEFNLTEVSRILHEIELDEFKKASVKASEKGMSLKLFDVTALSLLRPDGHPGAYRFFQPFAKDKNAKIIYDCLHWCLPGPIDSWNDLLMEMIVNY